MKVIAHTPTITERMSLPYRIVLVDKGDEYVVWAESFDDKDDTKHLGYHAGSYFPVHSHGTKKQALKKAYTRFVERATKVQTAIELDFLV